ncbi:MAG: amidohydrolase family protein, partial [Acidimicrobiales bacterium]|nr:amidohydrolase family protein [Acidimicrobiales bacterium]
AVGPTRIQFLEYAAPFSIPAWAEWFARPLDERKRQLADPDVRRRLDAAAHAPEVGRLSALANWAAFEVGDTVAPVNAGYAGRRVGEIAAEQGRDPFEVVASIALADDLRTGFWLLNTPAPAYTHFKADILRDPRVLVGGSDAGAHLDRMCSSRYPTRFLAEFTRDTDAMTVEEVVHLMTGAPAEYLGLRDRGRLQIGAHADIVVFDPATVDAERIEKVADLPGGAERLTSGSRGVHHVFVNGSEIITDGRPTGATPGSVLRSSELRP